MLNLTRYPGQKIIVTHDPSGDVMSFELSSVKFGVPLLLRFQTGGVFSVFPEGEKDSGPKLSSTEDLLIGESLEAVHRSSNDRLTITLVAVNPDRQARLGFTADKCFLIDREEIYRDKYKARTL